MSILGYEIIYFILYSLGEEVKFKQANFRLQIIDIRRSCSILQAQEA